MEKERYANFRGARKVEVLYIEVNEGEGRAGDAMYREGYYCTLDGKIIGRTSSQPLRKFAGEAY